MYNDMIEVKISVEQFSKELGLVVEYAGRGNMILNTVNVSRPGLQLAGFFDYFGANRVQVLGNAETQYLMKLTSEERQYSLKQLFKYPIPCLVLGRDIYPPLEMIDNAKLSGIPIFRSHSSTTTIVNHIIMYLNKLLAPSFTKHAGLIDVYGVGLLITGKSGIGKSETALELIKRGHRLVADDSVIVSRIEDTLIGTSPEAIRYFMEIRGIGIIDIRSMYGVGSVIQEKKIELVVELENWNPAKKYDRLGDMQLYETILEVQLPKLIIPVKPGRNLAIILEVAARNYRQKEMGYDAVQELLNRSSIAKPDNTDK